LRRLRAIRGHVSNATHSKVRPSPLVLVDISCCGLSLKLSQPLSHVLVLMQVILKVILMNG
jgi:hypothetical protein